MVKRIGKYELGKTLGKGTFSKVKYAVNVETNQAYAIKIIDKAQLAKEHMEDQLKREIAIMKHLKHDNIVRMIEVLQTAKHIYIVLDLITGGELFDRIVAAKRFDEAVGRKYFQQLITAIYYCHLQGIAHRDLKPENLLLDANDRLKVSDFGLSNLQRSGTDSNLLSTVCGTPNYVAPEVLKEKGYNGFAADVWSCGVILFVMLAGYLPFDDPNMNALFLKIERGEYRMAKYFSPEVKDLISKMLVLDPAKRITLDDIIATPWFRVGWDDAKFQEMKASCARITPSSAQCSEAIVETHVSEEPSSSPKAPAAAPQEAAVSAGLDAFDMMARLTSSSLNPLLSGPQNVIRRATRFFAVGPTATVVATIMDALEKAKCNPKAKEGCSLEIKGHICSAKGLLTYQMEILPTVAQDLALVEIRRTRGDTLDFGEFFRALIETLGPLTLSYGKVRRDA
eukprot:RCo012310